MHRARRTGHGEHVDLSVQESVASLLEAGLVFYTYSEVVSSRHGARALNPWSIYACRDGLIFLSVIEQDQWERLVDFMGRPEWALLEIFEDMPARLANADALQTFMQEWIGGWTVDALFHEGQKRRICFAPVLDMAGVAQQEHLRVRGFFETLEQPGIGAVEVPGAPFKTSGEGRSAPAPAPRLGEHQERVHPQPIRRPPPQGPAGRPLEGIRVADFSWVWAGPFAALQLAHLGADVVEFESALRLDIGRRLGVFRRDLEPGINRSGYFNQWAQGKRGCSSIWRTRRPSRWRASSWPAATWWWRTSPTG